jgi:hypothetical protein
VYVSRATGRVTKITAGCRTWESFEQAMAHYIGGGPYKQCKWLDDIYENKKWWGDTRVIDGLRAKENPLEVMRISRQSSLEALATLAQRVYTWQRNRKRQGYL